MKSHRHSARITASMLAALLLSIGCSGGGGSGSSGDPPADVSGIWETTFNNAGSAVLTGCTGDVSHLNGLSIAGLVAAAPNCPLSVEAVQTGKDFTFLPRDLVCDDGTSLSWSGGGVATGTSVSGQFDAVFNTENIIRVESFTGTVSGDTINLSEDRIMWSAGLSGACDVVPPLSMRVVLR